MIEEKWYVFKVLVGFDPRRWQEGGLSIFFPLMRVVESAGLKQKAAVKSLKPLFGGYVFVKFDITDGGAWSLIQPEYGIRGIPITGTGSVLEPEAIPDWCINELRSRCDAEGVLIEAPPASPRGFAPGEVVTLRAGPMEGRRVRVICQQGPVVYATLSNGFPVRALSAMCEIAKNSLTTGGKSGKASFRGPMGQRKPTSDAPGYGARGGAGSG